MADAAGLVRLTSLACELLGVQAAMVSLVDDRCEVLHAVVGLPAPYGSGTAVPIEQSVSGRMVVSGSAALLDDLAGEPVLAHHPVLEQLGLRSCASVPLRHQGAVVGGFCVLAAGPRTWTPDDQRLLGELGAAVSTELELRASHDELARSHDTERRLAAELAAVSQVATAVARGTSPELVLQLAAEQVAGLLPKAGVVVLRFAPDGSATAVARAGPATGPPGRYDAAVAELQATGEPAAVDDEQARCLAAPVMVAGRLWGALAVSGPAMRHTDRHTDRHADRHTDRHADLGQLTRLADLLGVGVSNREAQARLVELTRTDPLTGVENRRAFAARLAEELERGRRAGTPTTLLLLDLDRFKALNDRHGHLTGDRVLCELVARVSVELRAGDGLARLGGDEFAVVLPGTDYAAAVLVAERVRAAVAASPLAGVPLTVSIGAAVVDDSDALVEPLYRAADAALYRAKDSGRGGAVLDRLV